MDCDPASPLFFIYIYLKHNGDVLAKSNETQFYKYSGQSYKATCMSNQVSSTSIETECMNEDPVSTASKVVSFQRWVFIMYTHVLMFLSVLFYCTILNCLLIIKYFAFKFFVLWQRKNNQGSHLVSRYVHLQHTVFM